MSSLLALGGLRLTTDVMANAALYYTRILELRIFPLHDVAQGHCSCDEGTNCTRPGKHPRIADWQKEASKRQTKVARWWERWPDANVGVLTGRANGLLVIDIDPQNGGWLSYQDALAGHLPSTYSPITGGGGQHIWLRYPTGKQITNRNNFPRGLDVRGDGGFVVAAPSVTNKGRYEWPDPMLVRMEDLAECPPHIIERYLTPEDSEGEFVAAGSTEQYQRLNKDERHRIDRYVQEALDRELDQLEDLNETAEWDSETFKISCRILELVKAPWSPLTYEDAVKAIWRAVPAPDGAGWTEERIRQKVASAWQRVNSHDLVRPFPEAKTGKTPSTPDQAKDEPPEESRLVLVSFDSMEPEPYEWYEKNHMPKRGVVILAGEPGTGKSTLVCYYLAQATGGAWGRGGIGNALYLAGTEDSLKDIVKPRLIAAKADVSKIFTVEVQVRDGEDEYNRRASFKQDMLALRKTVRDHNIKMIAMDPANTFLGIDEERDSYSEIRATLEKVVRFADEEGILVVLIKHFKKNQSVGPRLDAMSRLFGSAAWGEVVRHMLVLRKVDDEIRERKALDSEDPVSAILSVEKNSYGRNAATGLAPTGFALEETKLSIGKLKDQPTSKFTYLGERKDLSDLDTIAVMTDEQVDKRIKDEDSAKEWLIETLQGVGGRMEIQELKRIHGNDERCGVSWRTLMRKAESLGIVSEKIEGAEKNRKAWVLPADLMPGPDELKM
ncbi:bifunctional DNA primase/polymerase [Nonomuraea sp. NPDC050451]|uniref:bifunctional DNA primase/polymerase n=1 Tax=Nonomuraea sp. NPDC050451 TaxID=3364364 RepID=UPI003788EDC1